MKEKSRQKYKILIADDSEMNRAILAEILGDEYEIIEAGNGVEAVLALQQHESDLSLVLLDIVMPEMDGFGVLKVMNQRRWIEDIPVVMISAESGATHVNKAYELGVTDFISRPFDAMVVHRRVVNTILLYAKQKKLMSLVAEQVYEKEIQSSLLIDILSHIVEFRNGESGLHVLHIRTLTEMLLKHLTQKTDRYSFSRVELSQIAMASALHDIGKISIASEILNKPGRLTPEEFAIMKTHSQIGAEMLHNLPIHQNEPLVNIAYEICRWHHERYDGKGYPDGISGDDIPISAQIVALADVYDALTSERVYKKAIPHEKAVQMILNGECGAFNPLLLECLTDAAEEIQSVIHSGSVPQSHSDWKDAQSLAVELFQQEEVISSERRIQLLEHERIKYNFFATMSQEIQFEYTCTPSMVTLSAYGVEKLGLPEIIMDPMQNQKVLSLIDQEDYQNLLIALRSTSPENPIVRYDCKLHFPDEDRWERFVCRATWIGDDSPRYIGVIGKIMDIHETRLKLEALERVASHDGLTNLLNRSYAQQRIQERMTARPDSHFAMIIMDGDRFKKANDTRGHLFGDKMLVYIADKLRQSIRTGDIAARIGGDEFLVFLEYKGELEPIVERIFHSIIGELEGFHISVSVGVARSEDGNHDYETMFRKADHALYQSKGAGGEQYCFYKEADAGACDKKRKEE